MNNKEVFFDEKVNADMEGQKSVLDADEWKILLVDDDEELLRLTEFILRDFKVEGRALKVIKASSAGEARGILKSNPDIALILLDIIMESEDAGLKLIKYIREDLKNRLVQIVISTGQPGYVPQIEVVRNYDINDYKTKSNMTAEKLYTTVTSGVRAYKILRENEDYRINLERKVEKRTKQLRLKNKELEAHKEKLELLNNQKNKLFSIISHDLRNPLTAFMGCSEVLMDNLDESSIEKELQMMIKGMCRSGERIFWLLRNLLDWAQVQMNMPSVSKKKHNMKLLISNLIELVSVNAGEKKICIQQDLEDIEVLVDDQMVEAVLRNLLSNAIKFTPRYGGIYVSLYQFEDQVVISVRDNGIGLEPGELKDLFKLDKIHSNQGTCGEKGTGLGLILCNELMQKHGGEIEVNSFPGKGSEFKLIIPATKE